MAHSPTIHQIADSFCHAASSYDEVAVLHREVADRLQQKLDLMSIAPECILDLGCNTGRDTRLLEKRYRKTKKIIAFDIALTMLTKARAKKPWLSKQRFACGTAERLPFVDNSFDMIYSNLVLQWCSDLSLVFNECARVLRPGGLLFFASYGPDTFKEMREISHSREIPFRNFIDMHDVGDALVKAQFSDPVLDIDWITMNYTHTTSLVSDYQALGIDQLLSSSLYSSPHLATDYEHFRTPDGQLPVTHEVVYSHAWLTKDIANQDSSETRIPLSNIRRKK